MTTTEMTETVRSLDQITKFSSSGVRVKVINITGGPRIEFRLGMSTHSLDVRSSTVSRVWAHFRGFIGCPATSGTFPPLTLNR